jgi:hypothetical protein
MGFKNDGVNVQKYVYDFSVDGGVKDVAIVLSDKDTKEPIPVGAIITGVTAHVATACGSSGSATVVWGNGDDADGYSGTLIAVGSLSLNAVFNGWDNAAALLWDDTNDHPIYFYVADADDGAFKVLIQTENLNAGKIVFSVSYFMPGV